MNPLDGLVACAGSWHGTNKLQDPQSNLADESAGTATLTALHGGRFVRIDYTWVYREKPQEGSLLIGFDALAGEVTGYWIDTWHMGDRAMLCRGSRPADSTIKVSGFYAAPPDPDWGWRIELIPGSDDTLRIVMFNIWPDGSREEQAVESVYERKKGVRTS